jgi:chemotaxis protein CheX
MKVEYINPFIKSVNNVFNLMLNCDLVRGDIFLKDSHLLEHFVSGVIGLSGKAEGVVVLSLCHNSALEATSTLLMEQSTKIDNVVVDAVGELTNMIAGGAQAQLEHLEMRMGLPTVITGRSTTIDFPKDSTPICIPFRCDWGDVAVEVGLV